MRLRVVESAELKQTASEKQKTKETVRGEVPYPNMQLDTGPFINKSLGMTDVFSIISWATDIALAPSATRRVFLKLESRLNS